MMESREKRDEKGRESARAGVKLEVKNPKQRQE